MAHGVWLIAHGKGGCWMLDAGKDGERQLSKLNKRFTLPSGRFV